MVQKKVSHVSEKKFHLYLEKKDELSLYFASKEFGGALQIFLKTGAVQCSLSVSGK